MKPLAILPLLFAAAAPLAAQLVDALPDEQLFDNPAWYGTLELFSLRDGQVRLRDTAYAGQGKAWLGYYAPPASAGTRQWQLEVQLGFAPSPSNVLRFYLLGDHPDPERMQAGYYLQVGGVSGDGDALTLYALGAASPRVVLKGEPGRVAKPTRVGLVLSQFPDGSWSLRTRYPGQPDYRLEAVAPAPLPRPDGPYLALQCRYTRTRAEQFGIDSLRLGPLGAAAPPTLAYVEPWTPDSTFLVFAAPVGGPLRSSDIRREGPGPALRRVQRLATDPRQVVLHWDGPLREGQAYTLRLPAWPGLQGGAAPPTTLRFDHYVPIPPEAGMLQLNELLFNPPPDGQDYVEVQNVAERALRLDGLTFINGDGRRARPLPGRRVIPPGAYLVACPDPAWLLGQYPGLAPGAILPTRLPPLPDAAGWISLFIGTTQLDAFAYRSALHSPWLERVEGVALERIDPDRPTQDPDNWHSAASSVGYGTPGRANSQLLPAGSAGSPLTLPYRSFSPDGDGWRDFLLIQYQASGPNTVFSLRVLDAWGRPVYTLASQALAGQTGTLRWDGRTDAGTRAPIGIYLLILETVGPQGGRRRYRDHCVLAGRPP